MTKNIICASKILGTILFLFIAGISIQAFASGFYTPDIGAKTVGRGAAWIVGVDDLSAIYLNPAGLANVKGTNILVTNNFDVFHTWYQRTPIEHPVHNENPVDIIQLGVISSDFGLEKWTFAIGMYGPYGVAEKYDPSDPQRYSAVEIKRGQAYYMVAFGWAPMEWLRVGGGVGIGEFSEEDTYAFSAFHEGMPKYDILAHVKIHQIGNIMYAAGVQLGPFNGFETGMSYQPRTDVTLRGSVKAPLPDLFAAFVGERVYTDKMTVSLKFPDIVRFGIRQRFTRKFDLEADAVWTGWSRFKSTKIDFKKEELMEDMNTPTGWRDTWDFRLGGDYELFPRFFIRAGGWIDQSATPPSHLEPGGIEMPRVATNGGFGYKWKGVTFDFGYSHIWMEKTEVNAERLYEIKLGDPRGKYTGSYDMFVVGVNLNFNEMAEAFKK